MAEVDERKQAQAGEGRKSALWSWVVVTAIAVGFFIWGILIYFTVGVKWPPGWRYGTIPDIPGQGPYSTDTYKEFPGAVPHPGPTPPIERQHVMGRQKEPAPLK